MDLTAPSPYLAAALARGAAHGRWAVTRILGGQLPPAPPIPDAEQLLAAGNYLIYVMFTAQLANGLHPRSATDFVPGEDRGSDLARQFITAGTVEICCDYCGELMTAAVAAAAAAQMHAIHGDNAAREWEALSFALAGPPF